jgi:hypothetical protein
VGFTVNTGAEGFWARRARTSVDVLGPGVLVGRVAGFGVFKRRFKLLQAKVLKLKVQAAADSSIRDRYLNSRL